MENLAQVAAQVKKGETINFIMRGTSMAPIIQPGDEVVISPLIGAPERDRSFSLDCTVTGSYTVSRVAGSSTSVSWTDSGGSEAGHHTSSAW